MLSVKAGHNEMESRAVPFACYLIVSPFLMHVLKPHVFIVHPLLFSFKYKGIIWIPTCLRAVKEKLISTFFFFFF